MFLLIETVSINSNIISVKHDPVKGYFRVGSIYFGRSSSMVYIVAATKERGDETKLRLARR